MGYVEMIFKDGSGLRIENDTIEETMYEYCGVCRSITKQNEGDAGELGTFICHSCLGWNDGQPA